MTVDFRLKQHLSMSPNAKIKNLVPENLSSEPPEEEWKLGRIWLNTTIGKLQGVFLKLDRYTGKPIQPEELEIRVIGSDALGETSDGKYWPDGLFDFDENTRISDSVDNINEALMALAPPEATLLRGDLNLTKQIFITGKVSKSDSSPIKLSMHNGTAGEELSYIISNPHVSATLPTSGLLIKGKNQQQFGKADQGIIMAVIDAVPVDEGVNLKDLFYEDARDYEGVLQGFDHEIEQKIYDIEENEIVVEANPNKERFVSSSGTLTINTIERYNDFKKWQKGSGSVKFTVSPGKHDLWVEHSVFVSGPFQNEEIKTKPFKTNLLNVFYDPSMDLPTSKISNFSLLSGKIKHISGVLFYFSDIKFEFDYTATHVFDYTYWDKPVSIRMTGSTHDLVSWNAKQSSLYGIEFPRWDDVFDLNKYLINYDVKNSAIDRVFLVAKSGKPVTGWGKEDKSEISILIDTFSITGNSTNLKETFVDEEYRLNKNKVDFDDVIDITQNTTGSWDSSLLLSVNDAQQYMGTLIKAKDNFEKYGSTIDYTNNGNAKKQHYYRRIFVTDKRPNSNGILKVETPNTIGTDFDIFIKLPNKTGWLNINKMFDQILFSENYAMDNIVGCGTNIKKTKSGYELPWTIGRLSTLDSGFGYLINIEIKSNDCIINEIEEISDTWR